MKKFFSIGEINVSKLQIEMQSLAFESDIIGLVNVPGGVDVHLHRALTPQEEQELSVLLAAHTPEDFPGYKVMRYVTQNYIGADLENVDFKRHLRRDVALNKKAFKLPDGRPEKTEYYYDDEIIAEITFVFDTTESNLITRRKEILNYYREDGVKSFDILVKDRKYDLTNLADGEIAIKERSQSRSSIVSSLKAFISGALSQATGKSLDEVVVMVLPFWNEYAQQRDNFIELGDTSWRDALLIVDPAVTPHTWLFADVVPGVTIKDYIVGGLSY